jgi:hypothetical protein
LYSKVGEFIGIADAFAFVLRHRRPATPVGPIPQHNLRKTPMLSTASNKILSRHAEMSRLASARRPATETLGSFVVHRLRALPRR